MTSVPTQLTSLLDAARQEQPSYEAFLHSVLAAALSGRQCGAQKRRMRAVRLPFAARLDSFDVRFQPSVSERVIRELASLRFLESTANVMVMEPPGVGKTHIACSLARLALEAGHSGLFVTLRELRAQLSVPPPRREMAVVRRYSQPTRLIVDEIGSTKRGQEQAQAVCEVMSAVHRGRSSMLTSTLSCAEWGGLQRCGSQPCAIGA